MQKQNNVSKKSFRASLSYHWYNFRIWLRRLRSFHSRTWGYFGVILGIGMIEIFFGWRAQVIWYSFSIQRSTPLEALTISCVVFVFVVILGFVMATHRHWILNKIVAMLTDQKRSYRLSETRARTYAFLSVWGTIFFVVLNDMAGALYFIYGFHPDFSSIVKNIAAIVALLFTVVPYPVGLSAAALHEGVDEERKEEFSARMVFHKRHIQDDALRRYVEELRLQSPEKILGSRVRQFMELTPDQQMELGVYDPKDLVEQGSQKQIPQNNPPHLTFVPEDTSVTGQFRAIELDPNIEDQSVTGGTLNTDPFSLRLDGHK